MPLSFNNAGPQTPGKHYTQDTLRRMDADEILRLIEAERYFVLHAPWQTGKTSCLLALRDMLNAEGKYRALYINIESAKALPEQQVQEVMAGELGQLITETFRHVPGLKLPADARQSHPRHSFSQLIKLISQQTSMKSRSFSINSALCHSAISTLGLICSPRSLQGQTPAVVTLTVTAGACPNKYCLN